MLNLDSYTDFQVLDIDHNVADPRMLLPAPYFPWPFRDITVDIDIFQLVPLFCSTTTGIGEAESLDQLNLVFHGSFHQRAMTAIISLRVLNRQAHNNKQLFPCARPQPTPPLK